MEVDNVAPNENIKATAKALLKKENKVDVGIPGDIDTKQPSKILQSIYSHRNEDDILIKHRPGKRSVVFSKAPPEVGIAAPKTFTRNYIKSNHKKKKSSSSTRDIHSDGLYMLMNNPEVLLRLDSGDPAQSKPLVKAADQSTTDSDLTIKVNAHDQMKISYFKPPIAGSYVPSTETKTSGDGSDGESNGSSDSGDENVYVFGQAERDEECLNILSNGLDEDEGDETFFTTSNPGLKETNIDEAIFSAKMTEVIVNASPIKKYKETSLIEVPPVVIEEKPTSLPDIPSIPDKDSVINSEESESSSMGSVDSGIHEAGTDSPVEDSGPRQILGQTEPVVAKQEEPRPVLVAPKPSPVVAAKPSPDDSDIAVRAHPSENNPASSVPKLPLKPKPKVDIPSKPRTLEKPKQTKVSVPPVEAKPILAPKPTKKVAPNPIVSAKDVVRKEPRRLVTPLIKRGLVRPVAEVKPMESPAGSLSGSEESESGESETSSVSSDSRPPSPDGHEMTYLQYDEEPMLPKYRKDSGSEKDPEPVEVDNKRLSSPVGSPARKSPRSSDLFFSRAQFIPDRRSFRNSNPEIPQTSLEGFLSAPAPRDPSPLGQEIVYQEGQEQEHVRELQRMREAEQLRFHELARQQQLEEQHLAELQAQQHIRAQQELRRAQELQLEIERNQLEELQRHRELQRLQELQRQELLRMQDEDKRHEKEKDLQKQLAEIKQHRLEEQRAREFQDIQIEKERVRMEAERQLRAERQQAEEMEKQRQHELLKQIEAEKEMQFEEEVRKLEIEKRSQPAPARNQQLAADFEDIDSLLMDLMEMDPVINQQSQQQRIRQLESEVRLANLHVEEARKAREAADAQRAQEDAARIERERLEQINTSRADEARRKERELEEKRERKRRMREMSLDDVLKLQSTKKAGSPTPSIRSEMMSTLKRSSNESLNSVTAGLDRGTTLKAQGGNQMIAPMALLHELINPVQEEDTDMRSRTLPVVVDNQLVPSPRLPPRKTRSATSPPSVSPSSSLTRGVSPNTAYIREGPVGAAEYDGTNRTLLSPNMNTVVDPYAVQTKIEPHRASSNVTPPPKSPSQIYGTFSPNTIKAKQNEQWLDIDDLLADVQSMITEEPRSAAPSVPPRIVTSSVPAQPSPPSANTSSSSYNEVFEAPRSGSPAPPVPAPPVPAPRAGSPAPRRPARTPPRSPMNTPPLSPSYPPRTDPLNTSSSSSDTPEVIPRTASASSASKGYSQGPNPHEDSLRSRSSADELNRRTQQLQRNNSTTSSFRSPQGHVYPLAPQPQEYMTQPTNITMPFYQPQKMYQRQQSQPVSHGVPPAQPGYPTSYSLPRAAPTGGPGNQPGYQPGYPGNQVPGYVSPPPLPSRERVNNSNHTVV